jgi:2'-5' RNA ligase
MDTIRTFIAVKIPDAIKEKFGEIQRKLKTSGADVRWVKPGNAHITLRFLGDIREEKTDEIQAALSRAAACHRASDVSIEGLGAFPNPKRPRVIWIGIRRGAEFLQSLQASVSKEMRALGFAAEDRPYSPHITLGRMKTPKNLDSLKPLLASESEFSAGTFRAAEIHFIRSILSSEGPTYVTLFSAPFLANPG